MDGQVLTEVRRLLAAETDAQVAARGRAEAVGRPPAPEVGALLRWAAQHARAKAAVEVGSEAGVTGLWLLPGLGDRGLLTSVEPDPRVHELAAAAYEEAGLAGRVRSILGDPTAVLPRLSDTGYDLVLLQDLDTQRYPTELEHGLRLLRPGGVLLARGVLRAGADANALAAFLQALADTEGLTSTVLPVDEGLALASMTGG